MDRRQITAVISNIFLMQIPFSQPSVTCLLQDTATMHLMATMTGDMTVTAEHHQDMS